MFPLLCRDANYYNVCILRSNTLAIFLTGLPQRLQDSLKQSDVVRKQRDDALQTAVIEQMSRSVKDNVASVLRSEIKQTVNPGRFIIQKYRKVIIKA